MSNPNRDERGRFATAAGVSNEAAARGDHLAQQPFDKGLRRVAGRLVDRSEPMTMHEGVPSVGTHLSSAAQERVAILKGVDERHFPSRTNAEVGGMTSLSGPRPVAPGKLDPRQSTYVGRSASGKPKVRVKAGG